MDLVKEVELPEGDRDEMIRDLLSEGVGEIIIDGSDDFPETSSSSEQTGIVEGDERKHGRELLEYGTRRIGDYYGHGVEKKTET